MQTRTSKFPYLLIALAALILLATSVLSVMGSVSMRSSIRWVSHTNEVILALRGLGVSLGKLEGELRGYSVSANPVFAERYEVAVIAVRQHLDSLRAMVDDSEDQLARLRSFEVTLEERLNADREVMLAIMTHEGGAGEAINIGVAFGEALRSHLDQMLSVEMELLEQREQQMQDSLTQTLITVIIANALAIAAVIIAFVMSYRAQRAWLRQRETAMVASQAVEASRQKSQFLASMSHEIRTPMNAIFGFTQLLEQKLQGAEERQYIRAISTSGRTLLALINDILDLSKIEADRLELVPEPVDLHELVDGAVAVFAQMAADKGITLQAEIAADLPGTLRLDPNRSRQVLFNLIGNAVKYTDQGGVLVRVSGERSGKRRLDLKIEVLDTGVGIDEQRLSEIFEPFVQVEGGDGEVREGTGLGLSIARRLVELMEGRLSASSELGAGSAFVVELPNCPVERRRKPRLSESLRDLGELPASRVLVVDDVEWNRELLQAHFEDTHHQVLTACDGEQALQMAAAELPDLILMDIRMPRMDGREALRRLRQDPRTRAIRVIAVTASSLTSDEQDLRSQFDGYLRKPFTHSELFAALQAQLAPVAVAADADELEAGVEQEHAEALALDEANRQTLQKLLAQRWPRLRNSLRMREAAAFGAELARCGQKVQSASLQAYGQRLTEAAQRFDVTTVQSLVEQVPGQLQALLGAQDDEQVAARETAGESGTT